jgi:DNA-binding response OmpR family regulator
MGTTKTESGVPLNMSVAKTILIIEDDELARELMSLALLKRGFYVSVAEDGAAGYDTAILMRPDLIVTDIAMPQTDGIELIRRVRDTQSIKDVPILVTTAFGSGTATFSLQHGADAYEPKPVDLHSFLATVDRLLTQCDTLRAA